MDVGRRAFLQGELRGAKAPKRPPWALHEAAFVAKCTRCDACIKACSVRIITRGASGFPQMDFALGACTFCGECVHACTDRALAKTAGDPWTLGAVIGDNCLTRNGVVCRSCGDACDIRAIRFPPLRGGVSTPALDATTCTGCGACFAACPVGAISVQQREPAMQTA